MSALLTLIPGPYRILALALLAAAIFGYGWIKGNSHAEAKLAAFIAETRSEGVKAQAAADARAAADRDRKAKSDASYQKALTLAGADLKRMRDARPIGDILPAAPADTRCPEGWSCFDRNELQSALRSFDAGVSGLAQEGDQVALRLKLAVEWAR